MDYYTSNNYYQGDITTSPQQQQSYYSYGANYRQQEGRYSNYYNRSRRNSSRAHSMVDQSSEEPPQSPYSSNYYNRPMVNGYRRPSSSYYKYEDDDLSSTYYTASPSDYSYQQQYVENVYASPVKNSRRTKNNENKQKFHDYPITPEEGRSFIYNNEEEINLADNNENYTDMNANNNGAITLASAYHQNNGNEEEIYRGDGEEEEEEEEEEDPTTQMNTMFNAESSMIVNSNHNSPHASLSNSSTSTTPQQQQPLPNTEGQHQKKTWFKNVVNSALVIKRKVKMLRKRDYMTDKDLPLHRQQKQPAIQFITATNNELLGDVLDAQQEKEILSQLSTPNPNTPSSFNMSPEKTKITNLDRIWVFRLIDPNQPTTDSNTSIAWIGFDYDNQVAIESHLEQLSNLPENERFAVFYDSHIRYGKMPVIVTPSESKGYYFANEEQTDLIMLQVTFIENKHDKVTFVYRV